MKTIPDHYPHRVPLPGERQEYCDYCGMKWYRSELRRDASGYLACPDDQDGRDVVTLDRANAAGASSTKPPASGEP